MMGTKIFISFEILLILARCLIVKFLKTILKLKNTDILKYVHFVIKTTFVFNIEIKILLI
jgi:hypothetical protein